MRAAASVALVLMGAIPSGACGGPFAPPTCTVGVAGTDLQVTASGGNAQAFCDEFIKANNGSGYAVDEPDNTGTLICRYTIRDGTSVTVRDKGLLKLYGNTECERLRQMQ